MTVGGVCFVAVEPEKGNANTQTDPDPPTQSSGVASTNEHRLTRTSAETKVAGRDAEAAGGKRKYRARGERSRKEQQRAASRNYRLRHLEYYREYGLKYRAERKRLQGVTS